MPEKGIKRVYEICRISVLTLVCLTFSIASLIYNNNALSKIFPVRLFTDQHIYQDEDYVNKERPDAYLRELIRYKSVYVPYDVKLYEYYNPIRDENERGSGFVRRYYTENNYTRYFKEYSKACMTDATLPMNEAVGEVMEARREDFNDLGIANDMLRYTFLLNKEHSKETKYFWYSWYYYSFAQEESYFPHVYVKMDEVADADELVAIWDEGENLYVTTRSDYENSLKGVFGEIK